jgi:hypothetical protein
MGRNPPVGTRGGGIRARSSVVWLAAALMCLPAVACTQTQACSAAVPPATFIGQVTAIEHGVVTFDVESATMRQVPDGVVLAVGQPVQITYGSDAKYLRVGTRYEVDTYLPGPDGNLTSTIAMASSCEIGTRYPDGHYIDKSIISIGGIHTGGIIALAVALALITVVAAGVTVRQRRRRADQRAIAAWKASKSNSDRGPTTHDAA